jgi:hypothetical protein
MLSKTKKFVKEHKTEIVLGIVVVGEIILLKDKFIKPETSDIDKVNLEKILDDMQNKIRDNKFEILDIRESLEK